jgi:tRNA A-37 threonylcarbamoyl transferase component Bud32
MTDRDLFIAALDHPDPADRAAWLEHACAGDPDRHRRVEVLLKAHDEASRFLADPAAAPGDSVAPEDPTRTAHPSDETAPATELDAVSFLQPADKPGLLGKLDHYEVIEVVGKGGMGVVLKAFDPKLHRLVALKLMAPHLAAHGGARKRFEREAKAVAAVKNEHVVAIHGVETDSPAPYLVMEFVGGVSLQDRLDRRGPADVKEILRIGMQAAFGLAAAHKVGIIHRDIKPANILLENGVERVKITDFGLARAADDANLTQSGVITGTPNYMSPEQAAGTAVDARSDLFSLGSVLYALCTGHPPFRAETPLAVLRRVCDDPIRPPREVNPDVPDWLDAIIRKLLSKNPANRFHTADDVAELLGQHLAHLQQPAAVPMPAPVALAAPGERVWRQIFEAVDRDRRLWQHGMILTGLVLVGLAAAVGIPSGSYLILFAPAVIGLALIAVGGFERQQWDVPYKGRTLRFENSPFTGERLFVDGVRIATGGFGLLRELRGTIPEGPGAGDEVRALCEAGFLRFGCRISVSEGGPKPPTSPPPASAGGGEARIRVRATGTARRVSLAELMRGRVVEPAGLQRLFAISAPLANAIDDVMVLARSLDPDCRVTARRRAGAAFAFDVVLIGRDFDIRCGQRLVRVLKIEDVGKGENFDVIVDARTASSAVRTQVLTLLRSKYPEVADTTDPADVPAADRASGPGLGCAAAVVGGVALALIVGFRDTIWNEFFRTGYFAAAYMIGVSAVLALLMNLGRRTARSGWERAAWVLGLVLLAMGTVGALGAWREDVRRFDRVSRALDVHTIGLIAACVVVNLPGLIRWLTRRARTAPAPVHAPPPPAPPTGPSGFAWLIVLGIVAVPFLLYWTHESFWEGYFRPGYVAPVYMLVSSGLLLAVLWWCRRQSEPAWYRRALAVAMAVVVGGTLIGLLMSWGEGSYLDKLGGASNWHNGGIGLAAAIVIVSAAIRVVRWAATDPRAWSHPADRTESPGFDLLTPLVLAGGFAALAVGFVTSKINGDPDLQVPARDLWRLLAGWAGFALACFGPFALLSRWYWRRQSPARAGRGGWVGVAGTVGILATLASAWFVINHSAAIRAELFGPPVPTVANLGMNWNRDLVSRVTLERDGHIVEEHSGKVAGSAEHVEPGTYTVRGFKNDQEVYREEFTVAGGDTRNVDLLTRPQDSAAPRLLIDCHDPTLAFEMRGPGHWFQINLGLAEPVIQEVKPGVKYRIGFARGNDVIHFEDIQLAEGEERVFRIPPVVRYDKRIELKPKKGSFPSDVMRMEFSPDRTVAAVERFDGPILVFDAAGGKEQFTIEREKTHCTAFGFTPDGTRLAYLTRAGSAEHVLRVVDVGDGHQVGKDLKPQPGREFSNSHALAYSPDGKRLAVSAAHNAGPDNHWESEVYRWELADGKEPKELDPLDGWGGTIESLRLTGDGSEVLAVNRTNIAAAWRWDTGKISRRYAADPQHTVDLVATGREHDAVAGWSTKVRKAFVSDWGPVPLREEPPHSLPFFAVAFSCLAFSADDRLIAAGTKGLPNLTWDKIAAVHVWDRFSANQRAILLGHADWPLAIAFDPDGKGVLTASKDGTVRHWKLP